MEGSTSPTQEKIPRAPNWTEAKHKQLALSWPAVTFYEAVETHLNVNSLTSYCLYFKLTCYLAHIGPATEKFPGIYSRIKRNLPSGTSPDTWISDSMKIYSIETKLPFKFLHAWLKLRSKWNTQQINECMHPPPPPPSPPPLDLILSGDTAVQAARSTAPPPEDQDDCPIGGKDAKRCCCTNSRRPAHTRRTSRWDKNKNINSYSDPAHKITLDRSLEIVQIPRQYYSRSAHDAVGWERIPN
ncbi:hypothetical protein VP01_2237g1 [Puccinia sorghi]|uniref:No apical meristem-associated C-terminal domain-containing protein n=1 Tax=Puccinia sorghi TaxID=27349 RepID=A0A0L6V8S4_9BASI|nr:hypothetical protein VP01_2237g1 [Puccinia sorghi]